MKDGKIYLVIVWIVGILAFVGIWIYAFVSWGLLFGLMFGWIPAIIGGFILGILWPVLFLVLLAGGVIFYTLT